MNSAVVPFELKALQLRQGPGPEADWPCVALTVKTSTECLASPAPGDLHGVILATLKGAGGTLPPDATIAASLAHLILALQRAIVPTPNRFSVHATEDGFTLAIASLDPTVGAAAARTAIHWFNAWLGKEPVEAGGADLARFAQSLTPLVPTAEMRLLLEEALRRNIPWTRLTGNVLQLGLGKAQRRLQPGLTDGTAALAVALASDSIASVRIMADAGIPVVRREIAADAEEAARLARQMGYPVVIKSIIGNERAQKHPAASDDAMLHRLFSAAQRRGRLLIEQVTPGFRYTVLIVDGRLIAATRANQSDEGTPEDVTADVHPENRFMVERAARAVGLDLAGIDFISRDISRSHLTIGGAVREISANPKWRAQVGSSASQHVARRVLETLLPSPPSGRIPTALITGSNGKTTTSRMVAAILQKAGHVTGLATTDGVEVGAVRIASDDLAGPKGARMLLRDPTVTAAVIESARGGIIKFGLSVDECTVGAVTNLGADHVGLDGIADIQAMARMKARVLRAAREVGVLNADDPVCMSLRDEVDGKRLFLVGREPDTPLVGEHLRAGGVAVISKRGEQGEMLILKEGAHETTVIDAAQIPATYGGAAEFNILNAMFAIAISFALGTPTAAMADALRGFRPDSIMSRGRAQFIGGLPYDVLLDYAGNIESLTVLGKFVSRLPVKGRRRATVVAGGNRQNWVYGQVAAAAAPWFDDFVCSVDPPRGRKEGEVGALLAQGLMAAGVTPDRISICEPFASAVDHILAMAQPGDLVVIIPYDASLVTAKLFAMGGRDVPERSLKT